MTTADWISIANMALTAVAIICAPLVALWIGGILERRSESRKAKLSIFARLVGLRHQMLSNEFISSLNLIDAVFVDDFSVRDAWSKYFVMLNDANLNNPAGWSIRDEKRRELLTEIVKVLKLEKKISTADLIRAYAPTFVVEQTTIELMERALKKSTLKEELKKRGLSDPSEPYEDVTIGDRKS